MTFRVSVKLPLKERDVLIATFLNQVKETVLLPQIIQSMFGHIEG